MRRRLPLVTTMGLVVAGLMASAAPAGAQARPRYPAAQADVQRVGYDEGYRVGVLDGERDGRDGRPFTCDYRSAYRGSFDREGFRRGYDAGYAAGYERHTRAAPGRRVPRGSRLPGYDAPSGGRAPYGVGYVSIPLDNGYADGYEAGLKDGEKNKRFDPIRQGRYRSATRGYDRRFGSRELYKSEYRRGFLAGYEDGYVDARRYGYRDGRGRWSGWGRWPF